MAKIFLDVNYLLDLVVRAPEPELALLQENICFISPLSIHILLYVQKMSVPNSDLDIIIQQVSFVDLTKEIMSKSLLGPTKDFEDNVQLHSAAKAECNLMLTADKELLKMKFFGITRIQTSPSL